MVVIDITDALTPILKWPGGKQDELGAILPELPDAITHYYEPFLGGGAVYLSIPPHIHAYVNDLSSDLITLYRMVAEQNAAFFETIGAILDYWRHLQVYLSQRQGTLLQLFDGYRRHNDKQMLHVAVDDCVDDGVVALLDNLRALGFSEEITFFEQGVRKSLRNKLMRMRKLELKKGLLSAGDVFDNIEAAVKAAFYYYLRYLYNHSARLAITEARHAAIFFFIRENAYASMFRFNKQGHFNIPYGGISYNRKNLRAKVERLRDPALLARFDNTTWGNRDFSAFMAQHPPQVGDFVFLDPPYDTEFSSYDRTPFEQSDQQRLATWLLNDCQANFMLVIKATPFIRSLYEPYDLRIRAFDKQYMYNVKDRNKRDVTHLMITNYAVAHVQSRGSSSAILAK